MNRKFPIEYWGNERRRRMRKENEKSAVLKKLSISQKKENAGSGVRTILSMTIALLRNIVQHF